MKCVSRTWKDVQYSTSDTHKSVIEVFEVSAELMGSVALTGKCREKMSLPPKGFSQLSGEEGSFKPKKRTERWVMLKQRTDLD